MTKEQMTTLLARLQQMQQMVIGKSCDFKLTTYSEHDDGEQTTSWPAIAYSVWHKDNYVDSGILHGNETYNEGCKKVESFEFNLRHIGWI